MNTMVALWPCIFVLEHVNAISNNSNSAVVNKALQRVCGYMFATFTQG